MAITFYCTPMTSATRIHRIVEERFATHEYWVGDALSTVDVVVASAVGFAPMVGIDWSAYPKVAARVGRVSSRPANAVAAVG